MDVTLEVNELRRTSKAIASYSEEGAFADINEYRMFLILKECCSSFGESYGSVMTKTRVHEKVVVRQVAMYLIKKIYPDMTLKRIGKFFIGMDHSTVVHGIKTTQDIMDTDKRFKEEVDYIELLVR